MLGGIKRRHGVQTEKIIELSYTMPHSFTEARTHLGGNREDGETSGKTLKEYPGIELPDSLEIKELGDKLLNEEINYNKDDEKEEHLRIWYSQL